MYMYVRYLGNVMYAPCSIHVRFRVTKNPVCGAINLATKRHLNAYHFLFALRVASTHNHQMLIQLSCGA